MCFLLGGMGLGLTVGLLDVLVLHVDALKTQNHSSGGLDLALGIPLLAVGALLATGHLHRPAAPSLAEGQAAVNTGGMGAAGPA